MVVENQQTKETKTKTSMTPDVLFERLPVGLYRLSVSAKSYATSVTPSVRITDGKQTQLSIQLQTSTAAEEVLVVGQTVTREDSLLDVVSTTSYDRETLRSAPGSGSDVLRALDGMPGLVSTGDYAAYTVRGRGPNDNLIYVDGVPFSEVIHFNQTLSQSDDIGGGRYSIFAPNLIEQADFSAGAWSTAYSGKNGSFLNLNVAEGNTATPSFSLRADLAGPEVTYDGPSYIHDKTSVLFSARQLDFGRFFNTIGVKDIGQPALTDVVFKSSTEISSSQSVSFLYILADETYERNLDNVTAVEPIENVLISNSEQRADLMSLGWKYGWQNGNDLDVKLYRTNKDKTSSQGEVYPDVLDDSDNLLQKPDLLKVKEKNKEQGLRVNSNIVSNLGTTKVGAQLTQNDVSYEAELTENWIRYVYDQNDFRPDPSQKYIELQPEFINSELSAKRQSSALYLEQLMTFGDWQFNPGVRYDYDAFASEYKWSPRLLIAWDVLYDTTLSTSAGRYYQAPELLDRARAQPTVALKNEVTDQVSLGVTHDITDLWQVTAETYYQDLSRLVVEGDRVAGAFTNEGKGESYGFDTVLNRALLNGWSMNMSYSYNQSKVDLDDGQGMRNSEFNRPHAFSIAGVWEINRKWKLSSRWKYASGRPDDAYIVNDDVLAPGGPVRFSKEITEDNTRRFDDYTSLNFRVDYRQEIGAADLVAFIDIVNMLANSNPNSSNFNERTGEHSVSEGSVFPQLGFRLEF